MHHLLYEIRILYLYTWYFYIYHYSNNKQNEVYFAYQLQRTIIKWRTDQSQGPMGN